MNSIYQLKPIILVPLGAFLLALGFHPYLTPVLLVALVPLLMLEEQFYRSDKKQSLLRFWGWTILMFLLWNIADIWWLWNASGWMTLGAWIPNAILMSLPVVLFSWTRRLSAGRFRTLPFVTLWIAFEWIHQVWELTFPWLNLGNALGTMPILAQWYEYTGILGGTLWFLVGNLLAYEWLVLQRRTAVPFILSALVPIIISLSIFYTYDYEGEEVEVVVVQPNLDCYSEKFARNPKTGEPSTNHVPYKEQIKRLRDLAEEQLTPQTAYVVVPETALHENVEEKYLFKTENKEFVAFRDWLSKYPNLALVLGMDSYVVYDDGNTYGSPTVRSTPNGLLYDKFNTALHLTRQNDPEFYHKSKLVIGAETTPFKWALPVALKDMAGSLGTQKDREVFKHPEENIKVAPVICYESIYGEFVGDYPDMNLIFVITNDGWWGDTPGHRQHLRFSQLRAIETRRLIARSANTGISCFINAKGEITEQLDYGKMGALRQTVKVNDNPPTVYTRYGDYLGRLSAFLGVTFFLSAFIRKMRE
ncbi:MAG: apolipoprotein N-acyltransferase [Bacteroidota bacterium]